MCIFVDNALLLPVVPNLINESMVHEEFRCICGAQGAHSTIYKEVEKIDSKYGSQVTKVLKSIAAFLQYLVDCLSSLN